MPNLNPFPLNRILKILTGLDDVEEGGSQGGLLFLELVEDSLRKVLLQERLAVSGGFKFLEASLQLLNNSSVSHFVA